jgi:hypothetical protein
LALPLSIPASAPRLADFFKLEIALTHFLPFQGAVPWMKEAFQMGLQVAKQS